MFREGVVFFPAALGLMVFSGFELGVLKFDLGSSSCVGRRLRARIRFLNQNMKPCARV